MAEVNQSKGAEGDDELPVTVENVHAAIREGFDTNKEIGEFLNKDHRHVGRETKKMRESGDLEAVRGANGFTYSVPDHAGTPDPNEDEPDAKADAKGLMAVHGRPYDFVAESDLNDADNIPEYVPQGDEWGEFMAEVKTRQVTGDLPHTRLAGPTGCGKSHYAEAFAVALRDELPEADVWGDAKAVPFFEVTMSHSVDAADLIGMPTVSGSGSTAWTDGKVTKALMASRKGPVVLFIDEINRATTSIKEALYSAIDHRGRVSLDAGRGGETIQGNPANLIVISAMNEGYGHHVEPLDKAEARRLGGKTSMKYLGEVYPERERDLIVSQTPADSRLAELLVECANELRAGANDTDSDINYGVPTSVLFDWARNAYAYDDAGLSQPVVRAGIKRVANILFEQSPAAYDEAKATIESMLSDCPFNAAESAEWSEDVARLSCMESGCSWSSPESEADTDAREFRVCPDCSGTVELKD